MRHSYSARTSRASNSSAARTLREEKCKMENIIGWLEHLACCAFRFACALQ